MQPIVFGQGSSRFPARRLDAAPPGPARRLTGLPILAIWAALGLAGCVEPVTSRRGGPSAPMETAAPEQEGFSTERLSRLDGVIQRAIREGAAPGAVVLVGRHGRVVYEKAFGERARVPESEEMTLDTLFDMASLTKVMATATSTLVLVEQGELSLSDPVVRYLPEFEAHGKEVLTLMQLLTHYSGLRPDLDLDTDWTGYETAIHMACDEKLVAEPGSQFIYSDINYLVLSEIVHRVSGVTIDRFSEREVFRPLGMHDTRFNPPAEWVPRIAPTEPREGRMLRGEVHDPTASRMGGIAGHAGLFSTARDTARFAQFILNGGSYGEARVLSPLGVRQMTSNQAPPALGEWRGLGFDMRSRFSSNRGDLFPVGSFGHTGFTGTSLWIDPVTETFVVSMTSRLHPGGEGNVVPLRKRLASVVAGAILDAPVR